MFVVESSPREAPIGTHFWSAEQLKRGLQASRSNDKNEEPVITIVLLFLQLLGAYT